MPIELIRAADDYWFRFVTRGAVWQHVVVFVPLGLTMGMLVARFVSPMLTEPDGSPRTLSRVGRLAIVIGTGLIDVLLVLAVIHGNCQSLTEGGSINWAQWRLLYHYLLVALLVAACAVDLNQYEIPDRITVPGTTCGLLLAGALGNMQLMHVWVDTNRTDPITGPYIPAWIAEHPHAHGLAMSIAGLVAGAGMTWLTRSIAQWVLRVEALGFGDVTLMAMIGSFLGWQPTVFVFLLAPVCGGLLALSLKVARGRRAFPYGPCLAASALAVLFTWRWLWLATRDLFGHPPTLIGLALGLAAGIALLLGLLRLYRAIPVTHRRALRQGREQPAQQTTTSLH